MHHHNRELYIVAAKRTAFGTFGGALKDLSATDMAVEAAKATLQAGSVAPEQVDQVIFGNVLQTSLSNEQEDALRKAISPHEGRVIDTSGDGAFCSFPSMDQAASALCDFFRVLCEDNAKHPSQDELSVRCGLHWGEVLTDGKMVSGEAVNLCSRVGALGDGKEIRITRDAFRKLSSALKLRCTTLPPAELKGITGFVDLFRLEWQALDRVVVAVRMEENGEELPLPPKDTISFGRFSGDARKPGNDIVLCLEDGEATQAISRYHFELRRGADGFVLRALSRGITEVDLEPEGDAWFPVIDAGCWQETARAAGQGYAFVTYRHS